MSAPTDVTPISAAPRWSAPERRRRRGHAISYTELRHPAPAEVELGHLSTRAIEDEMARSRHLQEPEQVMVERLAGIPDQIREALAPRSRIAMAVASVFGGGVPYAAHRIAHVGLDGVWGADWTSPRSWVYATLLLGCLLYSAPKVYRWALLALGRRAEALGFVVLTEGIMTLYHEAGLALGALVVLVVINAIATGVRVARGAE